MVDVVKVGRNKLPSAGSVLAISNSETTESVTGNTNQEAPPAIHF